MSTTHADDHKRREIQIIHIAAQQLGMDTRDKDPNSEYRSMLYAVGRVHSATELDYAGRQRVIEHLKACGFQAKPGKRPFPGRPHNCDRHPQLRKIEALLADAKRPWAYADTIMENLTRGVKVKVAFGDPAEWQKVIAALMADQRRRKEKTKHDEPRT
jgi:phage gp16-like protein